MLTKDDLFTSVSRAAVNTKQDSIPKPKRPYKKNRAKKRMVTQAESFQINKLLEANLTPKDENGLVAYLNGMDDDKIAKSIGPHVARDSVRHLRQHVFGITRKVSPPRKRNTEANELGDRLTNLEGIVAHAVERILRLEKLFDQLAEEIGFTAKV